MAAIGRTVFLVALATAAFASSVVAQQSEVRPPEIVRPPGGDGSTVTILRGGGVPAQPAGAPAGPTRAVPAQAAPVGGGTQTTVTTGPGALPPIIVYDGSGRVPVVRQGRPPGIDGYPQPPPVRRSGDGSPVGPSRTPAPAYGSGGLVPPLVGNQPAPAQPRPVCRAGYRLDGTCRDNP